jgi:hypothetical protein
MKVLTVEALKDWDEINEMIEGGSLKRSTLEKALVKVGSLASGEVCICIYMYAYDGICM